MSKLKVYISCPISVPQAKINIYAHILCKLGADVSFWDRGATYTRSDLQKADAILVLLEDNKWKQNLSTIPHGTSSEICYASDHKLPIYLGYYNGQNVHAIYETTLAGGFSGLPGTSSNFEKFIKAWKDEDEQKCPSGYMFGKNTDRYDDCDDCNLWDACMKAKQSTFKSPKPPKPSLEDDIELTIAVEHEEWVKSCNARRQNIIESLYKNACISAGLDFMPAPRLVDAPGAITAIEWLKGKRPIVYGTPGNYTSSGKTTTSTYEERLLILLM